MLATLIELLIIVLVIVVVYPFLNSLSRSLIGAKHSNLVTLVSVVTTIYAFKILQELLL